MKETVDPALSIDRARENWQKLGHSEKWIQQRMMGQETRFRRKMRRKKSKRDKYGYYKKNINDDTFLKGMEEYFAKRESL